MVYLPTFTNKNQPNVGVYTIHGFYGIDNERVIPGMFTDPWMVDLYGKLGGQIYPSSH